MSLRSNTSSGQLQVTTQQELDDEAMDDGEDVFATKSVSDAVSTIPQSDYTLNNFSTHIDPVEQTMMQFSQATVCVSYVDSFNKYIAENNARGVRLGRKSITKSSLNYIPFLFILVCLFSFVQTASAMSFRASTLSVYALER